MCLVIARVPGGVIPSVQVAFVVIFFLGEGLVFARVALLVYYWGEVVVCSLLLSVDRLFVLRGDPPAISEGGDSPVV